MTRWLTLSSLVAFVATAAFAAAQSISLIRVRSEAGLARQQLLTVRELAATVTTLRESTGVVPDRAGTHDDVEGPGGISPIVTATMQQAGLASTTLTSVSPEAQTSIASTGNAQSVRRRITLAFQGLTLPELGRFLAAWRSQEPSWIPASINVAPLDTAERRTNSSSVDNKLGTDRPLRVSLVIERTTIRQNGKNQ